MPDHSGRLYCSDECYTESRREYMRRRARANRPPLWPAWAKRGLVKDDGQRVVGDWRRSRLNRRSKSGCGVVRSYHHASGLYRIDHYLAYVESPYVALWLRTLNGVAELIGRFTSLDQAKAACERFKPINGEAAVNSVGDPILPDVQLRRAAKR